MAKGCITHKITVKIQSNLCLIWASNRKKMSKVKIYQRMLLKRTNIRMLEHLFML